MRLRLLPIITIIVAFIGSVQPVFADPVTAWFSVTVSTRYRDSDSTTRESIDPVSFVMSASFDDRVRHYFNNPQSLSSSTEFGRVTFAGVPDFGGPAVDGPPWVGASTISQDDYNEYGYQYPFVQIAQLFARVPYNPDPIDGYYHWQSVILQSIEFSFTTPFPSNQATAADMLSLLRSGLFLATNHAYKDIRGGGSSYLPGSFTYEGTFTQLDSAPVPEPASMLLVATGLLGAGVRRWRQRKA